MPNGLSVGAQASATGSAVSVGVGEPRPGRQLPPLRTGTDGAFVLRPVHFIDFLKRFDAAGVLADGKQGRTR
jgi:hypothetical protein